MQEEIDQLRSMNEQLITAFANTTTLVSIDVHSGKNVFRFERAGKIFEIETYNSMSDNVPQWKKDAFL